MIAMDKESLQEIGLSQNYAETDLVNLISTDKPEEFMPVNGILPSFSHAYAGIQFGNWAGQLGDGRCTSLGHFEGHRKNFYWAENNSSEGNYLEEIV